MEKFIYKYLTENFYVSTSEVGNDGIYKVEDARRHKTPIYGDKLVKEIVTVFGLDNEESKNIINIWAKEQKPDIDLIFYWATEEDIFDSITMPVVNRVFAQTLAQDLVPVKPLSLPTGTLMYLDFIYSEEEEKTFYQKVKNNINRFFKDIYKRIFGIFKN
jgi:hypothetical protein